MHERQHFYDQRFRVLLKKGNDVLEGVAAAGALTGLGGGAWGGFAVGNLAFPILGGLAGAVVGGIVGSVLGVGAGGALGEKLSTSEYAETERNIRGVSVALIFDTSAMLKKWDPTPLLATLHPRRFRIWTFIPRETLVEVKNIYDRADDKRIAAAGARKWRDTMRESTNDYQEPVLQDLVQPAETQDILGVDSVTDKLILAFARSIATKFDVVVIATIDGGFRAETHALRRDGLSIYAIDEHNVERAAKVISELAEQRFKEALPPCEYADGVTPID